MSVPHGNINTDSSTNQEASIESAKIALVVGVNTSSTLLPYRSALRYAEKDAEDMAYILKQPGCGFTLLTPAIIGEKATTSGIKQGVMNLVLKRTKQDYLLFYFAGHAIPIKNDIYFVTHDFQEDVIEDAIEVDSDFYLSMRWLRRVLYQSTGAGRVLAILDCCFAGNIVEAKDDPLKIDLRKLLNEWDSGADRKLSHNSLRLTLTSTGYNIHAQEVDGHGLMTGLLLNALRGEVDEVLDKEGHVEIRALHRYLQEKMPQEQRPDLWGKFGPYNCILASHPHNTERFRQFVKEKELKIEIERGILTELFKLHEETQHTQPLDHAVCHGASLSDLDWEKIAEFLKQERTQQEQVFRPDISAQEQLMYFGLLQNSSPTYGAILCFGQTPSKWIAGSITRCVEWSGNYSLDRMEDSREYKGSLLKQFELSRNFLQKCLRLQRIIDREGSSEEWEIPFRVLEEALANALVHREYANRTDSVRVEVFDDRVEISSPGTLLPPMTEELLYLRHKSYPRNPQIAGIFYLYGYIEKFGTGIQRMQRFMKDANLPQPEFKIDEDNTFTVVLYRPKHISKQASPAILSWPDAVEVLLYYTPEDEPFKQEFEKHLNFLRRNEFITAWYDRKIAPGTEWTHEIDRHLKTSQLILLFVSSDFLISNYCRGVELKDAVRRHIAGEACVIPILIRPVDWNEVTFGQLQTLPRDNKAISSWSNRDEAFLNVIEGIHQEMTEWEKRRTVIFTSSLPFLNMPYERNPLFSGREFVLERLHQTLLMGKSTALTRRQAISGLSGIGKTQTAVEYAYRFQKEYQFIIWIKADTQETLTTEFIALAGHLHLHIQQEQEQNRIVESVKRWFQEHSRWLLIFDNADDLLLVRKFIPSGEKGHILFTTRSQVTGHIAQSVTLEKMSNEEGVLFLLHRARRLDFDAPLENASISDVEKAREIVLEMDGLPLALDQSGAYIEETQCGLSDYLQLYRARQAELLKRRGRYATDHPESVSTTWSLSFEKIQQSNPAAADLLRLCAYLEPEAIPEELIIKGASVLGSALQNVASDPLTLHEAIVELLNYSLIHRNPDHTFTLHRLVQTVIRQGMNRTQQRRWAERGVKAVNRAFPIVEFATWPLCQRYLSHALVCAIYINQFDMAFSEAARLLNQVGYYLEERAQYQQAEPLLKRALVISERVLGPEHPDTASSLNNLARLYKSEGKFEQAEPLLKRALAIWEKVLGPEHSDTAMSLGNLAALYKSEGKYELAEPLLKRALASCEQLLGPEHPNTATTLNNLAGLYKNQDKYELAEPLLKRALAIWERVLGLEHPNTATSLNNLAFLYESQGKYEQAESLYRRALAIWERVLGPEHPNTAMGLSNLARLYKNQDKYELAEPLHQRALAMWERVLGPERSHI